MNNKIKIKFKTKLINFFTFGYIKRKAKKISLESSASIQTSNDVGIDANMLIKLLGGLNNITEITSTITTLKVRFINKELIQNSKIKELGAKGIIVSDTTANIVLGNWSQEVCRQMLLIKNKKE